MDLPIEKTISQQLQGIKNLLFIAEITGLGLKIPKRKSKYFMA